jgi:hypothetical protein
MTGAMSYEPEAQQRKTAIRFEIQFEDGSKKVAHGTAAHDLWKWLDQASSSEYCVHGSTYPKRAFGEIPEELNRAA